MSDRRPLVVAAVKWVDLRPQVDRLAGTATTDARRGGFSPADHAALEVALDLATSIGGVVRLLCAAPRAAERALSELGAAGAGEIVRVEVDGSSGDEPAPEIDGSVVAAALAPLCAEAVVVVCGDMSLDRGSGAVPNFLAHRLGFQQALGLLSVVAPPSENEPIGAVRRLDGGRREALSVSMPAVLSVEGSVATLRRASLSSLRSAAAAIEVVRAELAPGAEPPIEMTMEAWRPPSRHVPAPTGDDARSRIVELTGALVERTPPRRVDAEPAEAAVVIVDQLRAWGYLD